MADEGYPNHDTTLSRAKAKLTHALGWATGDRRVEAKGKEEPEGSIGDAEREVRQAHQELPPD